MFLCVLELALPAVGGLDRGVEVAARDEALLDQHGADVVGGLEGGAVYEDVDDAHGGSLSL